MLFLQLMIRHHQSGVAMAQGYLERATDPTLTWLATTMVTSQREEISLMTDMLTRRGGRPLG